ncbi:MAG: hypothetical protein JXR37_27755 [Kiritimatiellae bacterium]|nr:hypothetical protein [Kiritimatiellia bacterium]
MVLSTCTFASHHTFDGKEITWQEVRETAPKRVLWYHMLTSEPGRHDTENYIGGVYLFGDNPTLAMFAGTQHSGGPGKEIYPALLAGESFGEAWRSAVQFTLDHRGEPRTLYASWRDKPEVAPYSPELRAPGVLLGDGTLKLPRG